MRRFYVIVVVLLLSVVLSACGLFGDDLGDRDPVEDPVNGDPDRIPLDDEERCSMEEGYVLIGEECVYVSREFFKDTSISREETTHIGLDDTQGLNELIADLSGSVGLAVMSRERFDAQSPLVYDSPLRLMQVVSTSEVEEGENVFAKLLEDGVFEEVAFLDHDGQEVPIDMNPLLLEVFGAFTLVVFEIPMPGEPEDFEHRVYYSYNYGGAYLIHNPTGKVFATRNIGYHEHITTETEMFNEEIVLTVTLNEPVMREAKEYLFDEDDNPVLDENDNHLYETVLVPVLDEFDDSLVFTEGPLLTETVEVPLYEHYLQRVYDDAGEPAFDDAGEPLYEEVSEPVVDDAGDPVYVTEEVAVLDGDGNEQYEETFDVVLNVVEYVHHIEITYERYSTQAPLHYLVNRLFSIVLHGEKHENEIDILASNLDMNRPVFGSEDLYYLAPCSTLDEGASGEMVVKVSFDDASEELVLEEHMNVTAAGFTECARYVDAETGVVFCLSEDLKLFTPEEGLKTVSYEHPLTGITLPNGQLYFYAYGQSYDEYYKLYRITADGALHEEFITFGERHITCEDPAGCTQHVFTLYEGMTLGDEDTYPLEIDLDFGDKLFESVTLVVDSVDLGTSTETCEDVEGCVLYTSNISVLDDGTPVPFIASFPEALYPVAFDFGDTIPNTSDFHVTYEIFETKHQMERLNANHLYNAFQNMYRLEEGLYYLSYDQLDGGILLDYDAALERYHATYTNMPPTFETSPLGAGYIGVNESKNAIYYFEEDPAESSGLYRHFTIENLTGAEDIHEVQNLSVDYDGSVYFQAVDSFLSTITGAIAADGTIDIDTVVTEREIIRLRPIN